MFYTKSGRNRAFSLIELVIVVVILGIIAAIALPRMSKGAAGATDTSLKSSLAVMRSAIDLFQAEHAGVFPSLTNLPNAMTQYSDDAGTTFVTTKDGTHPWGPYLRAIPALPVGADKGKNTFTAALAAGFGWVYDAASGTITANCPNAEKDAAGISYNTY
jgi:prepilin-type N-terminal cleavage/methylation domain-containing protein